MASYIIAGLLWSVWLEWYTTRYLEAEWNYRTRIVHILFWPIHFIIFIITLIKNS